MQRVVLPDPPDPTSSVYQGNNQRWMIDTFQWMKQVKQRLEQASVVNTRPMTPFAISTYTAVNTLSGTDATSNFVATLVTAMQANGLTATRSAQ